MVKNPPKNPQALAIVSVIAFGLLLGGALVLFLGSLGGGDQPADEPALPVEPAGEPPAAIPLR